MPASFLREVKRKFWLRHTTGVSAQTPYTQLARMYWTQYLNDSTITNTTPLATLERLWVRKYLTDHAITPPNTNYMQTFWMYMVALAGVSPSHFIHDNEMMFYLNAP